jgi:hypothetical protein
MSNFLKPLTEDERRARYRVTVASRPLPGPEGLGYESAGTRGLLLWSRVAHVIAAEVGEPEGDSWRVLRLDAEPGEEAMQLAQEIQRHTNPTSQAASLKSVATDGIPTRWFPDLVSFEEDALSEIR